MKMISWKLTSSLQLTSRLTHHQYHSTSTSTATSTTSKMLIQIFIILIIIINGFTQASAQCPLGTTMSFEKISSVSVRGVPQMPLYSGQPDHPVTAECNNRCRAGPKCRAFLINYDKHSCTGMDYESLNRGASLVNTLEKTSYFEKICLSTPPCEKAWTFERVMGRELGGFDDRIVSGVGSRLKCEELCLKERQFVCRSGEYDYTTLQCRLSSEDRRTQPAAYRVGVSTVDYFENQCAPATTPTPGCDYEKHDNVNLNRPDLIRTAFSVEQCKSLCDGTRAFVCRSFAFVTSSAQCWLSSDDSLAVGGPRGLEAAQGAVYFQKSSCLDLQLFCNHDSMTVSLNTIEPFEGKLYSKEDPLQCETVGRSTTTTILNMPFSPRTACGVKEDKGKYSSTVVIQHHPLIQRKGDRMVQLTCHFEATNRTITNSYNVVVESPPIAETAIVNATAPSPSIKLRITDKEGVDITGARLGDELYLRIELNDDSVFGIFARDLIAKSGKTDESIVLIDSHGCPTDVNIFPELEQVPGSKALQGKFDAFKFADDVVVRFQVNVQFCLQDCLPTDCGLQFHQQLNTSSSDVDQTVLLNSANGSILNTTTKSFGRRKRRDVNVNGDDLMRGKRLDDNDSGFGASTPSALLPDYPLQREIIVEGISVKSTKSPSIRNGDDGDKVSMFCTSKTTLMAGLITMVTLQLTIIGTCCACLIIYKKPCCPHLGKHIHNNDSKDRESITTTVSSNPNLYYHLNSNHQSHGHQQRHLQSSHSSLWANISRIE